MEVQRDEVRKTDRMTKRPRPPEDPNLLKAVICSLTCEDLRVGVLQFHSFLQKKIEWHRLRGGRFHNERAAAYDTAAQELLTILEPE